MGVSLRLTVGVMGNVASMLLYAAPILTFSRVVNKRSTEGFSCVPYVLALFNCFLYTWYGLPVVSYKWENIPVVTINGLGVLLEISFILIYLWFSSSRGKLKVAMIGIPVILVLGTTTYSNFNFFFFFTIPIAARFSQGLKVAMIGIPVILVFGTTTTISTFVFHDHHRRKVFTGSIGLVASVAMYGSPLVAMKQVIETKSVEFMPFYLSLFSFLASSLWMAYGLLSHDLVLASPNLVGCPLGILQLVLYFKYKQRGMNMTEEPHKWDMEKNDDNNKQLMVIEGTFAKIEEAMK